MSRFLRLSACLALIMGSASVVSAGWPSGPWYDWTTTFHRNNQWPEPFTTADRQTVPNAMNVFVQRGWERQCLLGVHHFDENKALSTAGRLHVQYILTQAPPQHRTIFVERGQTEEITKARVDAVQQAVAGMNPRGALPEVTVSNIQFEGASAEYITAIAKQFQQSTPTPRLTSTSGSSSSGSSSGSGNTP